MKTRARGFDELLDFCERIPLIDCHDHSAGPGPRYTDPIAVVVNGYFRSDLLSASSEAELAVIEDTARPLEERWAVLEQAWKRTCHTGYARATRLVLEHFYDEKELSLAALKRMSERLLDLSDETAFERILEDANIVIRLENVYPDPRAVLAGTARLGPRSRLVFPAPAYHRVTSYDAVQANVAPLGRRVTTLDEYVDALAELVAGYKRFGAVAIKDQSAYSRTLEYGNPTRAAAEEVFHWLMEDPRRSASYPDGVRPLDDYLFHALLRIARDLDLPVQIHTGHMAGIRNDIVKTNAVGLTRVLELHREVRFDLFHANWPYGGEILYLAKNFPNVAIDFCWTNIIDPVYCQDLFRRALSSVPHGKLHGYGSDFSGCADLAWAHARIARENVAIALAEMVEMDWLDLDAATEVARAWLFDNANRFFRLNLDGPAPDNS
jgi:predicted TIM-barrel fold metal-dependent hydrolase